MTQVGIITALPEELRTISDQAIAKGQCKRLGQQLLVAHSGTGPKRAVAAAQQLLDNGANYLLSWGCAAGLNHHLKPGALLLPSLLITADGQSIKTDAQGRQRLLQCLQAKLEVHNLVLTESDQLVSTPEQKSALAEKTRAAAVDMESVAIARFAQQNQIPFNTLRVIADPADMSLPVPVCDALGDEGEISMSRLLLSLVRHPLQLAGLIRLGGQFRAAQQTLKLAAQLCSEDFFKPSCP